MLFIKLFREKIEKEEGEKKHNWKFNILSTKILMEVQFNKIKLKLFYSYANVISIS